ncbi:MAG TPA: glycosyltransferase family 2 protein [Thermoanaerobaculia bacterium]|nr:glycosyltransferase family 2 protein [Thermoanaerobaculia bacterium]
MNPYLSVVIPTYDRIETLMRVLGALGQQEQAPPFEVVLIDDGSKDETAATVRRAIDSGSFAYPLHFESQPNAGPGRARNRGTKLACGTFVVYIGDDTVPEPRFLAEHARVHRESGDDPLLACLGYTGWPEGGGATAFMDYINDYGLQFGYALIEDGAVVPFNFFYTSNISISRELLGEEPFDPTFPAAAWEDIELAWRLDAAGLKIRYAAGAVTRHYHRMSVDSFSKRQYTVGRSGAIFFRKHPELGHFLGVYELRDRGLASEREVKKLRFLARLGEKFRPLARRGVFERLMREHYLRGLETGLREIGVKVE